MGKPPAKFSRGKRTIEANALDKFFRGQERKMSEALGKFS